MEIYNPISLRTGAKTLIRLFEQAKQTLKFPATKKERDFHFQADRLGTSFKDQDFNDKTHDKLFTRYDTIRSFSARYRTRTRVSNLLWPPNRDSCRKDDGYPGIDSVLTHLERLASRSVLKIFAGFLILVLRKIE